MVQSVRFPADLLSRQSRRILRAVQRGPRTGEREAMTYGGRKLSPTLQSSSQLLASRLTSGPHFPYNSSRDDDDSHRCESRADRPRIQAGAYSRAACGLRGKTGPAAALRTCAERRSWRLRARQKPAGPSGLKEGPSTSGLASGLLLKVVLVCTEQGRDDRGDQ